MDDEEAEDGIIEEGASDPKEEESNQAEADEESEYDEVEL